jgi:hypothetical protein
MTRIIVERTFEAPLTVDELHAVETRMAPCLALYGVRWIRSRLSSDRRRMICEYEAADVASVRNVQQESQASFDRMWAAEVMGEA